VVRDTLREVAVGLADEWAWGGVDLAAVVPAAGGVLIGMPLGAAAGDALPAAEVAAGALAGSQRVVEGRFVEV
jgi:hypothetical protein